MKKIALVIALMLVIFGTVSAKSVDELDGFDWLLFEDIDRTMYIVGFMSAYSSVWEMMWNRIGNPTAEEEDSLERMFNLPITVGDLSDRVSDFYAEYDNRDTLIYHAILIAVGKDWWNSSEFQSGVKPAEATNPDA